MHPRIVATKLSLFVVGYLIGGFILIYVVGVLLAESIVWLNSVQ